MSESANDAAETQSEAAKHTADERVIAHVDKWMALIREISHEQAADI